MKVLFPILITLLFLTACSENEVVKNFEVSITPKKPPIIFVDFPLIIPVQGSDPITHTVLGPWMHVGFNIKNHNDKVITILAVTYSVTGPDGQVRTGAASDPVGAAETGASNGLSFGTIKAEADTDCDGTAEATEGPAPISPLTCLLDENNPSFTGRLFYISDILQGVEESKRNDFRGGTFNFEMRFEGWIGLPTDPQGSFIKTINFTVTSAS